MADDVSQRDPAHTPSPSPAQNESLLTQTGPRPHPLRTNITRFSGNLVQESEFTLPGERWRILIHEELDADITRKFFSRASGPPLNSPLRHHTRSHTLPRKVKETLNARSEYTNSEDDGTAEHRINQYLIKQEIGRGSFGAVHLAIDQYGQEYAVKEFSKSRLRKRAQSHVLRNRSGMRRPGARAAGIGFNEPLHRNPSSHDLEDGGNSLNLIKLEIAIMKKLHHPNLVSLYEVLDDPTEDSLYMVMEMCKKGVVMKVGLGEESDPYDSESCRYWFRDLILGIEYLHTQGIVHRDIKPDNCLLTSDDVLKVVDFGVSEMFEKDSNMFTAKSAGSPAFLPPELCVVKHGDVSGRAADIWSMGVTLYCLRYGRIPFEKSSIFELYDAIRNDEVTCPGETDEDFKDLIGRILEKDPKKRITMEELRDHPWVTKGGTDCLLSAEENTSTLVEPPTEEEMNTAITKNLSHAITVVKAVHKFKRLIEPASPRVMHSILGDDENSHFVLPPLSIGESDSDMHLHNRKKHKPETPVSSGNSDPIHQLNLGVMDTEDVAKGSDSPASQTLDYPNHPGRLGQKRAPNSSTSDIIMHQGSRTSTPSKSSVFEGTRGHARDPLEEENPYLFIGPSRFLTGDLSGNIQDKASDDIEAVDVSPDYDSMPIVSESPSAADIDIYEIAYREEIERISSESLEPHASVPTVYLNRRVDGKRSSLTALLERAKIDGRLETPDNPHGPPKKHLMAASPYKLRASTAFAAAMSNLKANPMLSQEQDSGEEITNAKLQEPLVSKAAVAKPGTATATLTTSMATSPEIVTGTSSEENQSGLRSLLSRVKNQP
ncbi:hypothetical protein LOZ65_000721 [Ophidiomyces ophidiicola]|nr:hypothetical protein LOZ65_000721 [Ophidiomyces ophidiicola]